MLGRSEFFFGTVNEGEHRGRKVFGRFLGQVVARQRNHSALICGCEEPMVALGASYRRDSVITSVQHDRRHGNRRSLGQPAIGNLSRRVSGHQRKAMPIRMNHHSDEVRVVERNSSAFIGRLIEMPLRGPKPPQNFAKLVTLLFQTGPPTLAMEVVLVPQLKLSLRRLWLDIAGNVLNVVTAPRYQPPYPLRPQRSDDTSSTTSPVVARQHTPLNLERIHE